MRWSGWTPTLEESARISGANLFTITRKITIPLVMPAILSGALLIMLYSMAHFGTVAVLGIEVGIYNIPTLIYEKIHQSAGSFNSIRTGTVLASVLVVTAAFILWLQNRVLSGGRYQIIAGKSFRPTELKLRGLRVPMLVFCLAYIGFTIVLPTVTIFLVGGLKTYGLPFTAENMTWENYRYILFEWKLTRDAIWNSISLGLSAAAITMFAGVIISYVIVKMKVRGKGFLEFLGMLPFSVPGSVIALGVILAWSGKYGINLYNSVWIILVAYIARYMAFSLKANSAALEQVHDSLVEAARASGATMWQALKDIVLPLVRPGMLAAFFLIFLPALRELTVSVMLYGPTTRTIGGGDLHAERGWRDGLFGGARRHRAGDHRGRRECHPPRLQGRAEGLSDGLYRTQQRHAPVQRRHRRRSSRSVDQQGRVCRHARPLGLRQDHDAAHGCRFRGSR